MIVFLQQINAIIKTIKVEPIIEHMMIRMLFDCDDIEDFYMFVYVDDWYVRHCCSFVE